MTTSSPAAGPDLLPVAVIAIDPGKNKCGIAVVDAAGEVLARRIVPPGEIENALRELIVTHHPQQIVLGNATTSGTLRARLDDLFAELPVSEVDERNSTLEARALFWEAYPVSGWRRLIPLSLQTPLVPIDDFAAVVLARRFLQKSEP